MRTDSTNRGLTTLKGEVLAASGASGDESKEFWLLERSCRDECQMIMSQLFDRFDKILSRPKMNGLPQ